MKKLLSILYLLVAAAAIHAAGTGYSKLVNPLIGTEGVGLTSGYCFPGATYPHGMVQFTRTYFNKWQGFVVNQNMGGGCDHMGNFPTFPLKGSLHKSPGKIRDQRIAISDEQGHAGYYQAKVQGDVTAEFTVTERTGMARYTFPDTTRRGTVIIGTGIASTRISDAAAVITAPNRCEGYADGGYFCGIRTPYKVYFVAEFDADAIETGTWKNQRLRRGAHFAEGEFSGLYFTFDTSKNPVVRYKIAISYVSVENARENLKAESRGWDFDILRANAETEWDNMLSKVEVKKGRPDRLTQFYTHLYHAFVHPSVCSDVNGEYMGADHEVHKSQGKQYTMFSNWDTYRTQIQLLAIVEPDVASDIVLSHQQFAEQSGGSFPRWVLANVETGIMQGDPTPILIANAWAFGARNYDPKPIFEIMKRGAEVTGAKSQKEETRPYLKQYLEKGYCPASIMLEYTSSDYAIGQFAIHAAGDEFASWAYTARAMNFKNIFNEQTGWLQSRNEDGTWKPLSDDWREATYEDYFWMVPYALRSLMNLIGGQQKAEARLDNYFRRLDAGYGDTWFASGNEPSFGIPWVYNWTLSPWKTQRVIRRVLDEQYHNAPDGLPGNDDLGSMGAWYVWACLGLYPEIPGVAGFAISTPLFPEAVIHGHDGDIIIRGGDEGRPYVNSLKLNGKTFPANWINWKDIQHGATLQFKTSSKPNKQWGTEIAPPSL